MGVPLLPRLKRAVARRTARALVRLGDRGLPERGRRPVPPSRAPAAATYEICTFVTDEEQYAAARASWEAAGLGPPQARFVELRDRRTAGGTDPYGFIRSLGERERDAYVVLVHQDVLIDQGAGAAELAAALRALDAVDPAWVVAGTAGGARNLRLVRRLRDPHGGSSGDPLPAPVVSLDENLLVFNRAATPRCSPGLEGFHFYGTDVALNARLAGGGAYVLDFPVTHLSSGNRGPDYDAARARFLEAWQDRFEFALVRAPTEPLFLTRRHLVRRIVADARVQTWIREWGAGG